jgi:hypothetical protein
MENLLCENCYKLFENAYQKLSDLTRFGQKSPMNQKLNGINSTLPKRK